jgi:hypothetical protein
MEFERAGKTTHPHSVGEGRELSAIKKLKDILPDGIGVGSGFVIDSFGKVSSQSDIIIYEKNLCLKFNNTDSRNCYYNCESVIAVGEVKSDLSLSGLKDSIKKLIKIKNLKRYTNNDKCFRKYLSTQDILGAEVEKINPFSNEKDQIFTFLICKSLKMKIEDILEEIKSSTQKKYEYINFIISIEGKCIGYGKKKEDNKYIRTNSSINADSFLYTNNQNAFGELLVLIFKTVYNGRTVSYNPNIYVSKGENEKCLAFPL